MSRASRLEPLADYAGKMETEASRRLAASLKGLQAKEREVEQLRGYLAEYRQRAALAESSADPLLWQNMRTFLTRLSDVVAAQERELAQIVERHRLEVERWRDSHRRAKSLDSIVERAEQQARDEAGKRAQAELDELLLRRTLRRG